tara:strand:+ start:3387 stop:4079 length:693 start_codon:yes stop_codon:yes gene_type:complete
MIFFIYFLYNIITFNINSVIELIYPIKYINRNLNLLDNSIDFNLPLNNYKKTITLSKFLKQEKTMKLFNYDYINLNNTNIPSINSILINNITDFVSVNIKSRNIKNETLYLIGKKTKVYIHIELLLPRTNIYHIGVTFKSIASDIRYDIHGINLDNLYSFFTENNKNEMYSKTLFWAYSDKTLDEIIEYEKNIEHKYILGIYDCRHYVRNLTMWACNIPTPVWKLIKLVD